MMGEHEAGKGSVSRVKDLDRYRKGYDGIKWSSKDKKAKVKNGRDSSNRASRQGDSLNQGHDSRPA